MMNRVEVLRLFQRQHGVARVQQLQALGVSWNSMSRARKRRLITDVLPGVVRLAGAPSTFEMKAMAAQLQAAPDGFLCGFTAGVIRGISGLPRSPIRVMVPRRPPGQRSHSHQRTPLPGWIDRSASNWHDEESVVTIGPFRVETPESMIFTIASMTTPNHFERIAEKAWNLKIITPSGMADYVETYRRSGRSGVTRVIGWLDNIGQRGRAMQSDFEGRVLQALRSMGLPEPRKQYPVTVADGSVKHLDLAWPELRLAIEPGHTVWHHGELAVAEDAARDHACAMLGWYTMRFTEEALENLAGVRRAISRVYRARLNAA